MAEIWTDQPRTVRNNPGSPRSNPKPFPTPPPPSPPRPLLTDVGLPFCTLPLQNDPDVKSFWEKWAGGGAVIAQQAASAQKKDVVAPWFGEWNETSNQAWQSVFLNRATPEAATTAMARKWAELGHEVTVVCGLPNHPDGIIPEKYRGTLLYREQIDGVNVLRCWLYATPNRGVFKRSIAFMS